MTGSRSLSQTGIHLFLLGATILLVNVNSLFFDFCIDDFRLFVDNPFVHSLRNIPLVFSRKYFALANEFSYRPVETLSYFLDYALFGLRPAGYHVHNLVLELLNGWLVYGFIRLATGNLSVALLAGLIFAVHPAHSETVSAVSYRNDPQVLLFGLLSLCLYVRARRKGTGLHWSLLCLIPAFLAKESAVTFAGFVLLYEYTFGGQPLRESLRRSLSFFLLTAVFVAARFSVLRAPVEHYLETITERLQIVPRVMFMELRQLFLPFPLYGYYQFAIQNGPSSAAWLLLLYLGVGVIYLVYLLCFIRGPRTVFQRYALFSFGWVLLGLIPVSNIYPLAWPYVEKYIYIPSVGVCLFYGYLAWRYLERRAQEAKPSRLVVLSLLVLAGLYSAEHNYTWSNELNYWATASRRSINPLVCYSLGAALMREGENAAAEYWFQRAIEEHPRVFKQRAFRNIVPLAYCNLGALHLDRGEPGRARGFFARALELKPDLLPAAVGVAVSAFRAGDRQAARRACSRVLRLDPGNRFCRRLVEMEGTGPEPSLSTPRAGAGGSRPGAQDGGEQ